MNEKRKQNRKKRFTNSIMLIPKEDRRKENNAKRLQILEDYGADYIRIVADISDRNLIRMLRNNSTSNKRSLV